MASGLQPRHLMRKVVPGKEPILSQLDEVVAYSQSRTRNVEGAFGDLDVSVTYRRVFAGLFDLSILGVVLVALVRRYGYVSHTFVVTLPGWARMNILPKYWSASLWYLKPAPMLLFLAIVVSYFTVFEASFGWTPGKLVFNLRVVDFFGGTPTVGQALLRNLMRLLDAYPYVVPNLVGMAILLSNRRRQRGGDKA